MRLHSLFILAAALPLAMARMFARAIAFAVDAIDTLFASPTTLRDMGVFPRLATAGGHGVDPALQHSLRHEAGVSRRAAARNT